VPEAILAYTYLLTLSVILIDTIGYVLMHKERAVALQRELATHDALTGAASRLALSEEGIRQVSLASRNAAALSLLMFDIDHFKNINDSYGHLAGDHVLKHLASVIKTRIRREDVLARYGGEEFAIVLPQADIRQAEQVAQRIRKSVKATSFLTIGSKKLKVTISAGVCQLVAGKIQTRESLIGGTDTALYVSKREGRNRVIG
jgi:diguanylate cyclase (GGDEF)-like protein